MTPTSFLVDFPEFVTKSEEGIASAILKAVARLSPTALGDSYDEALGLTVADMLASSPAGIMAKNNKEPSVYARRLQALRTGLISGGLVAGVTGIQPW